MAEGPVVETSHFQSDVGLIPSPGTKIPYGAWHGQKKFRKPFLKVSREELIYICLYIFMA